MKREQRTDPKLTPFFNYIELKQLPIDNNTHNNIISLSNFMVIDNKTLYYIDHPSKRKRILMFKRIVVPDKMKEVVMKYYHDSELGGHLGFFKTYSKLRHRFFWDGMYTDVKKWISTCDRCNTRNDPLLPNHIIEPILSSKPFELVVIDHYGPLPKTNRNNTLILLMVDHFTGWVEAVPVPDKSAITTADALYHNLICRFGVPQKLLSDNGTSFTSQIVKELAKYTKMDQSFSTPYHPQTNGIVERFNRTLSTMLSKFCKNRQETWDQLLPPLIFAYNSSINATTSISPFVAIYGRDPRLLFDDDQNDQIELCDYVNDLKSNLIEIRGIINSNTTKKNDQMVKYHKNKRHKTMKFNIGDKIYIKFPEPPKDVNRKFYSQWRGPYSITKINGKNITARSEFNIDEEITVHINRVKLFTEEVTFKSLVDNEVDEEDNILTESESDMEIEFEQKQNENLNPHPSKISPSPILPPPLQSSPPLPRRKRKVNTKYQYFTERNKHKEKPKKAEKKIKFNSKNTHIKEHDYEVESVIGKKIIEGVMHYRVKFKGFSNKYDLWLPLSNLKCPEAIAEFERTQTLSEGGGMLG